MPQAMQDFGRILGVLMFWNYSLAILFELDGDVAAFGNKHIWKENSLTSSMSGIVADVPTDTYNFTIAITEQVDSYCRCIL